MLSLMNTVTICIFPIQVMAVLVVYICFAGVAATVGSSVMPSAIVRSAS
jgi:hypothetical protein